MKNDILVKHPARLSGSTFSDYSVRTRYLVLRAAILSHATIVILSLGASYYLTEWVLRPSSSAELIVTPSITRALLSHIPQSTFVSKILKPADWALATLYLPIKVSMSSL